MSVLSKPAFRVEMKESEYQTLQPSLVVSFPEEMHYRLGQAVLNRVAAAIELRSVPESWIVNIGRPYTQGKGRPQLGQVYLELGHGSEQEAARGIRVLEAVAAEMRTDRWLAVEFQGEDDLAAVEAKRGRAMEGVTGRRR